MKTIRVSGASGIVLDWLVASIVKTRPAIYLAPLQFIKCHAENRFNYCELWAQGGPIFSEAKISASIDDSGVWIAWCQYNYADEKRFMQSGPTELVAKARCYVAMNLGLAVVVPEDL